MSHQQYFSYVRTGLPGLNQYLKLGLMSLAHGHNAVTPVRFSLCIQILVLYNKPGMVYFKGSQVRFSKLASA